jgi:glucose/arabinose dehydrogenase
LAAVACSDSDIPSEQLPGQQGVKLEVVASGLTNPLYLTAPAGDARLFIVEQAGRIRIVQNGQLLNTPFLDLTSKVRFGGEQGLLSLAFHPQYASNGYFFVNYTDTNGDTRVERYRVSSDPNRADAASAKQLLFVDQPYANHNGGHILFGPDGMLYVGMGDGGSGGDPQGYGQNRNALLGKILRIDVTSGDPYGIPSNNPFVGTAGVRPEIWAYGLRNPWRLAFDRTDGTFYVADVGQNAVEEVNVVPAATGGQNYGWNIMEGSRCYGSSSCARSGLLLPVTEYSHADGCSVTGGVVYRGSSLTQLRGHYFYGDYCQGWVRSFRYANGQATDPRTWDLGSIGQILSFGEDSSGEMYVLSRTAGYTASFRDCQAPRRVAVGGILS